MAFFDIFKKKQDTPPTGEQAQKQQEELSAGLEKTKTGLFSKLARAVAGRSTIDAGVLDDLEEVLISSDVGVETTVKIIRRIEERVARDKYMNASELQSILRGEIATLMEDAHGSSENFGLDATEGQPYVVMVVGVNGAGKTTTIGKLAAQLGKTPVRGVERLPLFERLDARAADLPRGLKVRLADAERNRVRHFCRHFEKAADARRLGDFYAVGEHLLVVYHDIMTSLLSFSEGSYSTP